MIVTVLVVAVLTLIGTVIWWAMMNDWEAKDRRARGHHVTDRSDGIGGGAPDGDDQDRGDGPVVMKL